jgi:hypothetical protein
LRGPDIHGSKIPMAYFDYLRTGRSHVLRSVFSHNAYDILSLAALTVLAADRVAGEPQALDDPRDVYSLGRVFDRGPERSRSIRHYEMALDSGGLPAELRVRALERLSVLYTRTGQRERSLDCCLRLIGEPSFNISAYERAAIHYERRARDFDAACRILGEAIGRISGANSATRNRLARLESRRARLEKRRAKHAYSTGSSRTSEVSPPPRSSTAM